MRRELVDQFRGRWVAVNDDDVVTDAEEFGELLKACEGMGFTLDVVVHRVSEVDAPLFVSLG
jgi:hypothetical protein